MNVDSSIAPAETAIEEAGRRPRRSGRRSSGPATTSTATAAIPASAISAVTATGSAPRISAAAGASR